MTGDSDRLTVADRARDVVRDRLEAVGYRVESDSNRASGRLTVIGTTGQFEVFVSGANGWGYPFWTERRLQLSPIRFAAVVRFSDEGGGTELYLIPTVDWLEPELPLVNPQYEGLTSEPEFGVRLSAGNYAGLQRYRWDLQAVALPR